MDKIGREVMIMEFELGEGLVNLDGADVASVVKQGKRVVFFIEEHHDITKISKKITGAKGLIIGIGVPKGIAVKDCFKLVETLSENAKNSAKIIWGASVSKKKKLL